MGALGTFLPTALLSVKGLRHNDVRDGMHSVHDRTELVARTVAANIIVDSFSRRAWAGGSRDEEGAGTEKLTCFLWRPTRRLTRAPKHCIALGALTRNDYA